MKNITLILVALFTFNFVGGQSTKLAELTFENAGGYSTSVTEYLNIVNAGNHDYFTRTDGSSFTFENFSNIQGNYFFAAQDISTTTESLLINDINISGYTNLQFRVHLAEDDDGSNQDWDNTDYVHFNYDIDNSGSYTSLLWIEASGTNTEPQIDTNFDGIGDGAPITDTFTPFTQNIFSTGSVIDIEVVFRLNAGEEDIAIDNIEIWGDPIPCGSVVTWDGTSWSPSTPDLTTQAVISGDYNTANGGSETSFSACSLTITNNSNLYIADNTFVEVQNDLTVDAGSSINVEPAGAFVQNNDLSSVTNNGVIQVDKMTAPMNESDEYTYWSSPVSNTSFIDAVPDLNLNKCYIFNGQNFLDATAETGNNNASNPGQDDIDDDWNDWQQIGSSTIMQPGVGYATTISDLAFAIAPPPFGPKRFRASFEGDFNNGKYTVPIYRNDSELNDNNWNFVGNPYPSAIDADMFLAANSNVADNIDGTDINGMGYIDGAIFLWSQNTAAANNVNGNETFNFSNTDYAIINATGETEGGDGTTAVILASGNRAIPSGQGFFVSMSNSAPADLVTGAVYKSNIMFSNSMRVTDVTANNVFFKGTKKENKSKSEKNKLWVELTSDNGVFNQILIGYVPGASIYDDGLGFDAPKYPTQGAALYSVIEGSNKKFAIQGKPINSINEDEIINLGFKTTIKVATLYTLSIAKMEGDFLNSHSVFVKDNLLNKVHDLTVCDYTFTSETGEFNNRFEIVFKADALSTANALVSPSQLKIAQLDNDNIQFTAPNGLRIKTVSIFDLFGRQLYQFNGQNDTEVFKLSNLNRSVFVAEVALSNGTVISKKALKK